MLEDALAYPTSGEDRLERLLVGGVLLLLSPLLVPLFVVYGYLVRCLAAVASGEETPPPFDDWGELLVDGLKAFLVTVVYGLVPVVLAGAVFVPVGMSSSTGGTRAGGFLAVLGVLAALVFVAVVLVVAYVIMAALSHFAVEGRLDAAFDFRAIGRLATSEPYVVAVVLAVGVQVALFVAVVFATVFTFGLALLLLVPLGAFVQFWLYLVTVYLFGRAYRGAMTATTEQTTLANR